MTDQETIKCLTEALQTIGSLPLEFNGRARAIAQRTVVAPAGGWKGALSPEQTTKILSWAGGPQKEKKAVNTETKQPESGTEVLKTGAEKLYPVDPTKYLPPAIEMIPVVSSNLLGCGHDGIKTLRVWFKNGSIFDYVGTPEQTLFDIVNNESAGKAYNAWKKGSGIVGIKQMSTEG